MGGPGAGGAIAATADDTAMGADVDLQEDRILGARKVIEGLAAPRTPALMWGELVILDDDRDVGIVASFGPRLARLLAPGPTRWRVGRGGRRCCLLGGGSLGLSTKRAVVRGGVGELGASRPRS
jgi:hypothetical protein